MTRRGTTGIAWLIGLVAMLVSSFAEPAMARVFGSHEQVDGRIGSAERPEHPAPVGEPRSPDEPHG